MGTETLEKPKIAEEVEHEKCFHEWRVISDFHMDPSRSVRIYAFYCTRCIASKAVTVILNKQ